MSPKIPLFIIVFLSWCATNSFSQNWIPQGHGLLPFGYKTTSISVVDNNVVWLTACLPQYEVWDYPVKIFRSVNAGESWSVLQLDECTSCKSRHLEATDANTAWLTTYDQLGVGRLFKTEDGGESWDLVHTSTAAQGYIEVIDGERMMCRYYKDTSWSNDGGENWETGVISGFTSDFLPYSLAPSASHGDSLWIGLGNLGYVYDLPLENASLIRSTSYGQQVEYLDCGIDSIAQIRQLSFRDHQQGVMIYRKWVYTLDWDLSSAYAEGERDFLAITNDGGESWSKIQSPAANVRFITQIPLPEMSFAIVDYLNPSTLYWTTNGGSSWKSYQSPYELDGIDFSSQHTGWVAVSAKSNQQPLALKWNGDFTSGIYAQDSDQAISVTISPNPAHHFIDYSFGEEINATHDISLLDATGRVLLRKQAHDNGIDISFLPQGMYYLQIQSGELIGVAKFLKI